MTTILWGKVLPLALGAAVSPTFFVAVLALLTTRERPRRRAVAFSLGAAVLLVAIAVPGMIAFPHAGETGHKLVSPVVDLVFGVILLLLAVRALWGPAPADRRPAHRIPTGLAGCALLGLGFMATNFSSLALFVPAVKEIGLATSVPLVSRLLILVVVILISLLAVLVPLAVFAVAPRKAEALFSPPLEWMRSHTRSTVVAACLIFGVYLCVKAGLRF